MKILTIIPTLRGGGAERVISRLIQEWGKFHQVTAVFLDASRAYYDCDSRIVDLGLRLPISGNYPMRIARKIYYSSVGTVRLITLLRQEQPDRIFSFMEQANFVAVAAAFWTGCLDRLYVSVRMNPSWLPFVFRVLLPWLYRLPAGIIAVSQGVKRGLESMRIPTTRILVIPNPNAGMDRQVVKPASLSPLMNRFILGVGRLGWEKGFDLLLAAFRGLGRPEIHLVILGEGEDRAMLINLAKELGIENRVHFPGYITDVETWYRLAECFVMSSRYEGWPNVLMEAMANGCPGVSFDCKYGPSEIIQDGENGLLVPEGDVEGLAKAIARVLDDEALRRNLVVKGLERVKMFDVTEIAARWLT